MVTCPPLLVSFTQRWTTQRLSLVEMEKKICSDEYLIADHTRSYLNNSQIKETTPPPPTPSVRQENMWYLGNLERKIKLPGGAPRTDAENRDGFLTFANDQTALVSRYCVRHLLQSPRSPHVAVASSSAAHHAPKTISLLRERKREKQSKPKRDSSGMYSAASAFLQPASAHLGFCLKGRPLDFQRSYIPERSEPAH